IPAATQEGSFEIVLGAGSSQEAAAAAYRGGRPGLYEVRFEPPDRLRLLGRLGSLDEAPGEFLDSAAEALRGYLGHEFEVATARGPLSLDSRRCSIMGILNVTPDSFSDGGLHLDCKSAVEHGLELGERGAAVVDVGGESARPGSAPVSEAEELDRVVPVVE